MKPCISLVHLRQTDKGIQPGRLTCIRIHLETFNMTSFLRVNILGKESYRSKRLFFMSSVFIRNNPCQPCSVKMRLSFSDWFIHLSRKRPAKLIVYMTWALSFPNISPVLHFSFLVKRILEHAYYPEEASAQVFFHSQSLERFQQ